MTGPATPQDETPDDGTTPNTATPNTATPNTSAPDDSGTPAPDDNGTPDDNTAPAIAAAASAEAAAEAAHAASTAPAARNAPADPDLARLAALHGVDTAYEPVPGRPVHVPRSTVVAVLAALGVDASGPGAVRAALAERAAHLADRPLPPCLVVRAGAPVPPLGLPSGTAAVVTLEDGEVRDGPPGDGLPLGHHTLRVRTPDGRDAACPLIVVPDRVPVPPGRSFGFMVQLYSLLSRRSWGMGDLADLAEFAGWAGREAGAGFLTVNPLHTALPPGDGPGDPSPYRPSSRRFPDPVHLRVEAVPEYAYLPLRDRAEADRLLAGAERLRAGVLERGEPVDRDAVWRLKSAALELVCRVPLGPGRLAAHRDFVAGRGTALDDHATWSALAERHGPDWHAWPAGLRDPRSAATARAREDLRDRVDHHRRLAWLTDEQLGTAQRAATAAGMPVGIVHDLAVGVHPAGSDAWALSGALAAGMSTGAPPDAFNAHGQDWGLPPWRPDALAAAGYAPYRDLLRNVLRHAGGVRIDHVMGLFRLWWVPQGRPPTEGTYVRYDAEAMLGVLALEAHRAGAVVIGEDLGTVEPGVRERLAERGVLGTSVLWFERAYQGRDDLGAAEADGRPLPPSAWRTDCLATVTTHDLPSTAARLTGEHVELRHRLGLLTGSLAAEQAADSADVTEWLAYLVSLGLLPEGPADQEGAIRAVHRFLARTPARMVGVWLPDAVGDRRPQNVPGTTDSYPNWRLPVADGTGRPVTLEELAASTRLRDLTAELRRGLAGAE
ncbi:4-alpha-glucanotransferase [Streptomyces sp. SL13]|uniref:4-alpha-glucanotransferase n=1 Tax=Streptantibioticus silvisoli TaxID=2705255 RepID=A0AA90H455_9ACTN|nr:4-alpha-glucanotransferase [Streptantibioticus silvisoli]MDI5973089.1 4-alpha-glucanotransferase [Streptantibioticus silvisoli]